ncbi:dephospho-CoA kinase [Luteimonas sp. JM171]|uniref:dephospho-CoA kinase n=1 Tax=Luteimonas sp. JM171 TaxID=1896164 RepID=UPI000856B297|nr:dephospho-CoA kinase [Luteimonas sp. JM171]AOH37287.1 dephospho-CoA kinase [Luteimonas sp. JM171]
MLTRLHDFLGLRTGPATFFISLLIIAAFSAAMSLFPGPVQSAFGVVASWLRYELGWMYTLGTTALVLFAFGLAASRYGRAKLGPDDAKPEFSGVAWFGMLFAAGVGAVLMFWGVAEPMNHYANPPLYGTEPATDMAAMQALAIANFHFGIHMWALLVIPGMCFGYFTYKRRLPPRVSSALQPLIGEGIHGPWGRAVDITCVVATVFGLAVSVGLGAMQINAGMNYVMGVPMNGVLQAGIIAVITALALASALAGLDQGVKRLSYLNIVLTVALMLFVLMWGASMDTIRGIVESAGAYMSHLPALSFFNDSFGGGRWSGDWTVFYYAWTVTWSPFVGLFIARISRGRSIREFVTASIGLPTAFVIIWMGTWGFSAFRIDRAPETAGSLTETIVTNGNVEAALFQFLQSFPFYGFTAVLALVVITIFFVTSLDSGALVLDNLASGHGDVGPKRQRVLWAMSVGVVCAVILVTSGEHGLAALQEVIIVIGAPVMLLVMGLCLLLLRALREDAGTLKPLRTRQWKQVLPVEEYRRRAREDEHDMAEYVIRPEYEPGTEPEHDTHPPATRLGRQLRDGAALLTIGLTGGIGSGRTLAAEDLRALGAVVISADELVARLIGPGTDAVAEIRELFGDEVIAPGGNVDRAALGRLVSGNDTARARLNQIIHPRVRAEFSRLAAQAGPDAVVVADMPMLAETDQPRAGLDLVLVVEAPAEVRVERLVNVRGMTREEAWERIDAQPSDAEYREIADAVIVNDAGREALTKAVRKFWDERVQPVLDEHAGGSKG